MMSTLPETPDKRYFNIGEVAKFCLVKPSVLRFWEQEFPMLKPSKRVANRRYYQLSDVQIARQIRELLYDKGFTIAGARQQLNSEKKESKQIKSIENIKPIIKKVIKDLDDIIEKIKV
jgi:DNA-binding transcriptional MerR regulator